MVRKIRNSVPVGGGFDPRGSCQMVSRMCPFGLVAAGIRSKEGVQDEFR